MLFWKYVASGTFAVILAALTIAPAEAKSAADHGAWRSQDMIQEAKSHKGHKGEKGKKSVEETATEKMKCPGGRDKDGNCKGYQGTGSKAKGKGADSVDKMKCPGGRDKDGNCKGYQGTGSKDKGKGAGNIGKGKNK